MDLKNFLDKTLNRPMNGDKSEYFNEIKRKCNGYILSKATKQPTAAYSYEADVTGLWRVYNELKSERDYKVSFNAILMRIMVEGLKNAPRLNAHMDYKPFSTSGRLIIKEHIDIAVPVVLENGETFTIKILHSEEKNLKELQEEISDVIYRMKNTDINRILTDMAINRELAFALTGKLPQAVAMGICGLLGKSKMGAISDLFNRPPLEENALTVEHFSEGTVCFSNWGTLDKCLTGAGTQAPLLYPQVFMMGVGTVQDREYPFRNDKGEVDIGVKKILPITLTFDHRIGALNDVLPFIKTIENVFENPEVIKNW